MDSQNMTVRPTGALTIRDSEGLAQDLLARLTEQEVVEVEASEIESADITVLQVFIAAHRTAQEKGKILRILIPPESGLAKALKHSGIMAATDTPLVWEGDAWVGIGQRPEMEEAA